MQKKNKGITLIALIITIIVLLILAGIVISLTIGENGIINRAKESGLVYDEQQAREKLELVLLDIQADKITTLDYNENEYIDNRILENGIDIVDDVAYVNGWAFSIDRSVPCIKEALGQNNEMVNSYIQDGLIGYYDGENNMGDGHSSTATTWKDLSKSGNDAILTNFENNETNGWQEKSLQFSRKTEQLKIPISLEKASTFSLDIVIKEGKKYFDGGIIFSNIEWSAFAFHNWSGDGSIYIGGNYIAGKNKDRFIPGEINYRTTLNKIDLFTYTYNGQTKQATFYANGKKIAQKTFTRDPEAIEYFFINGSQMAYSRISIYNKVLTEDEVKQNYEVDKTRFNIE